MQIHSRIYFLFFLLLFSCNQYKSEYSRIFEQMYETLETELDQSLEGFESTMTNVAFVLQTKGDSLDKIWVLRRGEEVIEKTEELIFWINIQKDQLLENQSPKKVLEIRKDNNPLLQKLNSFTNFLNQKNRLWKLRLEAFEDLTSIKNVEKMTENGEEMPRDFMSLEFENVSIENALLALTQKQIEILEQGQILLDKLTEDYQAEVLYNFDKKLKVNIISKNDSLLKTEVFFTLPIFANKKRLYPKKLIWEDSIYNFRTAKVDIFWKVEKTGKNTKTLKAIFYNPETQKDTILQIEKAFFVSDTTKVEEAETVENTETPENEEN